MFTSRSSSDRSGWANDELVAHAQDRLIEAQAGLDADDHQVERVGQAELDLVLALLRQSRQHDAGQQVAEERPAEARTPRSGRNSSGVANSTKAPIAIAIRMP